MMWIDVYMCDSRLGRHWKIWHIASVYWSGRWIMMAAVTSRWTLWNADLINQWKRWSDARRSLNTVCCLESLTERIVFKVIVQTYWLLCAVAPLYLWQFTRTADILSWQRLQSSTTDSLLVPAITLSTVGHRTFHVTGNNNNTTICKAP